MPIVVGDSIENYRILARIGAGGMGMVYLAEQSTIGRKVALKVIHKELADNHEIVTRFFNEARAVNRIGNDHIVEINDLGKSTEGDYFFVMEYLDGRTLALVLAEDGPLDVRRALHVSAQISDALGAAHQNAIIHRDLKPDNVMLVAKLADPNFVKVLDFGLAKMFHDAGPQLTARGVILGTPQYMPPEACEANRPVDHRADIYALGVLMFEMMTGRVPFNGRSTGEVLIKQVKDLPPAPRALNPSIPPSVEQIILRCLAKTPEQRFQSMEQLRTALLHPDRYIGSGPPLMHAAPALDSDSAHTLIQPRPALVTDNIKMSGYRPRGPHDTLANLAQPIVPRQVEEQSTPRRDTPRPTWAPILALSLAIMVIGLILAVVLSSESGESPTVLDAGPTDATTAATLTTVADSTPSPPMIRVTFNTIPAGAKIIDENGEVLGTTPDTIELTRDDQEHVFTLRHPRGQERTKTVRAREHQSFEIELGPAPGTRDPDKANTGTSPPR